MHIARQTVVRLAVTGGLLLLILQGVLLLRAHRDRTALERRVDTLLAAAPAWRDSVASWTRERARQDSTNAALRGERDAYKAEAARWHATADARDSGTVVTRPPTEQVVYWHDKYLAATREAMATTAALTVETRRADSLDARAVRAEDRVVRLAARLDTVTTALGDLRRSQECRIRLVVASVACPSRGVVFIGGLVTGALVTALAK